MQTTPVTEQRASAGASREVAATYSGSADGVEAKLLQAAFGGRWIGVRLLWEEPDSAPAAEFGCRLCELAGSAHNAPALLTPTRCTCPGASYALGWQADAVVCLAEELQTRAGIADSDVWELLEQAPHLRHPPQAVLVGDDRDADVYISYAQPLAVMKLIQRWHVLRGSMLSAELSSIMAVCSGAILAAYLDRRPALSFGCPDSRKAGRLARDRLVLAVPGLLVEQLARGNS